MDDIKETAGRRGKTIQEARSMAMTRKDFRRWTEDPTLKGKRERERRRTIFSENRVIYEIMWKKNTVEPYRPQMTI
jgi:hypothetical protein